MANAVAQCDLTLTPTNIDQPTCGANDGSFRVEVGGITAPYQYTLTKSVGGTFVLQENGTLLAGTLTFDFLTAGTYKVMIAKGGTCSGEVTVELPQTALTLTPTNITQATCGGKDGSFRVEVGGITAPYQYTLVKDVSGSPVLQENGTLLAGTLTFVFLTAGTYKVMIAKGGTCSGSVTVELPQAALTLTPINITQATCGGNNGSFNVQVGGITAPYQYTLVKDVSGSPVLQENGTLIGGTPTFVFLTAGTYKVMIAKGGTCSGSVTVELPQSSLTLTPTNINPPTCGANNGSFNVQVGGITAPYQYTLVKDVSGSPVLQENGTLIGGTPTFVFLTAGTYKVMIAKGGTCSGSVTVELPQPSLTLLAPTYDCATGAFRFNTCGGDGSPITFSAIGITGPTTNPNAFVDTELRTAIDAQPLLLRATQSGVTVTYVWNIRAQCPVIPSGGALTLLAPTYDCTTGAFRFNTSGGDGSPITFSAIGITGPTTNPNAFVDVELRTANDVQPLLLQATQSGVTVTYLWDLKAACGRARLGAAEPDRQLRVSVLGNPVVSELIHIEVNGAGSQPLWVTLVDQQGRRVSEERVDQALATQRLSIKSGHTAGVYLLQVSTPSQSQVVRVLKTQ
ncbi:T9SS type A sorting domain-containing protein [Rudanella paleaurantiibacter]|uniref:T9SS type A sorting domain-containing protein n=1 Tax=Rudanella paleaurantiibacter TaxID=2614655 RepID=UPI001C88181C|nr:T9SS type A sorting domain-containing protein [Rudanella paleaurantiibacter]